MAVPKSPDVRDFEIAWVDNRSQNFQTRTVNSQLSINLNLENGRNVVFYREKICLSTSRMTNVRHKLWLFRQLLYWPVCQRKISAWWKRDTICHILLWYGTSTNLHLDIVPIFPFKGSNMDQACSLSDERGILTYSCAAREASGVCRYLTSKSPSRLVPLVLRILTMRIVSKTTCLPGNEFMISPSDLGSCIQK
jgi:hypothetical protein